MKVLRYNGIYILKAPVDRLMFWKQVLMDKGIIDEDDPNDGYTITNK